MATRSLTGYMSAMAEQNVSADVTPSPSPERVAEIVAEFQRKLRHVARNYDMMRSTERRCLSFNESLVRLARAANPRSRSRSKKARLHPMAELLVNYRALKILDGGTLTPEAIEEGARQVADSMSLTRGRPTDSALTYHVQALMALWRELSGTEVTAAKTKDSVYEPRMTSAGGRTIEAIMKSIDLAITRTAIVNVIISANASGAIEGKSFQDFFPFYGGSIDAETGFPLPGPGYRLESFAPVSPIYCS